MGIFALGVSFAPALGPTVGGYLTEYYGWRMVFFINVPIGILILIAGAIFLPKERPEGGKRLNFVSLFFLSLATVALLVMLSKGQQYGWLSSTLIGVLLYVSVAGYLLYILAEIHSKEPLIDFRLFKNPDFTSGILIYFFILGFSMYQYFYLLPVYYEHIKGLPTLDAGIAVFAFALFIGIFSPIAGMLSDRIGPKITLLLATAIYLLTAFFLLPRLEYYTPLERAILYTIPFGIAMGLFFAPVTVLLLKNAPETKSELAIVLMDYVRFVGGSFGTALATNNMEYFKNLHFDRITELQNVEFVADFLAYLQRLLGAARELVEALFYRYELFMGYNYGFYNTFIHAAYWALLGSVFVLTLFWSEYAKRRHPHNS
jgi:DHA2 family multidrug resistance protein